MEKTTILDCSDCISPLDNYEVDLASMDDTELDYGYHSMGRNIEVKKLYNITVICLQSLPAWQRYLIVFIALCSTVNKEYFNTFLIIARKLYILNNYFNIHTLRKT